MPNQLPNGDVVNLSDIHIYCQFLVALATSHDVAIGG
eukprot:CAMPEP_0119027750 /NCGR_PEP_ID=MMETSP1176-20130426/37694_1 /TAXON_ID=265551 /ORGANISM="Synedropsis recta cf, Strain CCMP1620" /LENGTH=36 /DNA_ID= /DNA_START= /DNA_END= /DNA_ORIENTATION=